MVQLHDVNTTDIGDAIRLGCQAMGRAFNADDADMPYGGAQVRPEAFLGGSMEGHMPGRLLNAMLAAEDATGLDLDEEVIDKHARAAFFSYSRAPLPLQRIGQHTKGEGDPIELQEHNEEETEAAAETRIARGIPRLLRPSCFPQIRASHGIGRS